MISLFFFAAKGTFVFAFHGNTGQQAHLAMADPAGCNNLDEMTQEKADTWLASRPVLLGLLPTVHGVSGCKSSSQAKSTLHVGPAANSSNN